MSDGEWLPLPEREPVRERDAVTVREREADLDAVPVALLERLRDCDDVLDGVRV